MILRRRKCKHNEEDDPSASRCLLCLFVLLVHEVKKLFDRQVVDGKKFAQAFDSDVSLAFFYPPVLYSRQIEIIGKILMAAIALLLSEICKLGANPAQRIT